MNRLIQTMRQAVKALTRNMVRTALTTLGIIIGIATVIMVFSIGEGFKSYITGQIETFGTNTVFIQTRVPPTTKALNGGGSNNGPQSAVISITTLKNKDIEDIKRLPNVVNVYGAATGQKVVSYGNVTKNTIIFGASPSRFDIDKGKLSIGRPYTAAENAAAAQVAILGSDIAKDLFGQNDPIDKTVRVGEYNFVVIGVYERRGSFGFSNDDQQLFVPLFTAQKKLLGIDHLILGVAQMRDQNMAEATAEDMRFILRKNHSITDAAKDDFEVMTQAEGLDTLDTILNAIRFLLIAIGAISLVVGGVGIMNIMYVVVTERTAEIGLKKALGATQRDIRDEFLIEALFVTLIGGVLGIIVGAGLAYLVAKVAQAYDFEWKFIVPISGVVIAVGVSGTIGLIFGVFPARKASKLDPIQALGYE